MPDRDQASDSSNADQLGVEIPEVFRAIFCFKLTEDVYVVLNKEANISRRS